MMRRNLLLCTDSYKASHWLQYPPGTTRMFSYIEARSPGYTIFFGLQAIIDEYLSKPITEKDVFEAGLFFKEHGEPFNFDGWMHIVKVHGGRMPVRIRAVPEGTMVPNGNVLVTIESLDANVPWIASYLETLLLRVWYPTTVATISHQAKQLIRGYMLNTCDTLDGLPFKLHDFGGRGVSSGESAMLGGMGHLVNFYGTDTVEALVGARHHYHESMAGFSIPAAEHSTITSWGKHRETDAYRNMVAQYSRPGSIYAVVSDSYDLQHAVQNIWGGELKRLVQEKGGTLVVRPDSGDPVTNVHMVCWWLEQSFGSTVNSKGYKVLNNVRVIQGDGIDDTNVMRRILTRVTDAGYSAENVAFGMGGGLLQKVNRDTFGFAMKCSAVMVDGVWQDVFKEAPGKASKRGRLDLVREPDTGFPKTVPLHLWGWEDKKVSLLQTVFDDGFAMNRMTLKEIRNNTGLWT